MILDFLQQRFSYVHQVNIGWIRLLAELEDLPQDLKSVISKLINSGHISVVGILDREAESELDDVLPEMYWEQLERDNFQLWLDVFMQYNQGLKDDMEWLTPRLFKALHENAQYLGQLKLLAKNHGISEFNDQIIVID